jgi:hypothetical protein
MGLGRGIKSVLLTALSVAALGLFAAGCGEEQTSHVVEGEPLELGELDITVQLTRFLNPFQTEDSQYLEGLQPPPAGSKYLAVFVQAENVGNDTVRLPTAEQIEVEDTQGVKFHPVESDTVFALALGSDVPGDESVPVPDTAAAEGPVQGSIILFLIPTESEQNRPLEMHLDANGHEGTVELDL